MSKLCDGLIPPRTPCPFKDRCQLVSICRHLGVQHITVYSCSAARMYDRKEQESKYGTVEKEQPIIRDSCAPRCDWDGSYERTKR